MFKQITCYECHCDGCGVQFEEEATGNTAFTYDWGITNSLKEQGWHDADDNIHYCPACYAKMKGGDR